MHNIQFTITINQLAISRKGFEIDIIDAAIIDFVRHFIASEEMDIKDFDGERYYRLHSSHVASQLPILGVTPGSLTRRISSLIEKGYFKRCVEDNNTPWIRPTDKAKSIYGGSFHEVGGSGANAGVGPAQTPDNNSTSNKNTETQITCALSPTSTIDKDFEAFWEYYPKGRKKAKKSAHAAFLSAMKRAKLEDIVEGFKNFLLDCHGKDPRFIPLPATWLNGDRWNDEYEIPAGPRNFGID